MAVAMIGPKFYAWDRNGKPLAFGKLYTYQARTNIPKPTYQSEDKVVENTNPVILNGEGYANVYLDGSYKMVLKDKDENEIWTSDPVTESSPSEWVNCISAQYVSPLIFSLIGNFISEYQVGRRVRIDNNVSDFSYSTILETSYSGGETKVTISDPVVTTGIIESCVSITGPDSEGGIFIIPGGIKNVGNGAIAIDSVDDFPNATWLKNGDSFKTTSYRSGWAALMSPPKGAATYDVRLVSDFGSTPDGFGDHYVGGGTDLVAVLRVNKNTNVHQYGARGDGDESNSDHTYINAATEAAVRNGYQFVRFLSGDYNVNEPIETRRRITYIGNDGRGFGIAPSNLDELSVRISSASSDLFNNLGGTPAGQVSQNEFNCIGFYSKPGGGHLFNFNADTQGFVNNVVWDNVSFGQANANKRMIWAPEDGDFFKINIRNFVMQYPVGTTVPMFNFVSNTINNIKINDFWSTKSDKNDNTGVSAILIDRNGGGFCSQIAVEDGVLQQPLGGFLEIGAPKGTKLKNLQSFDSTVSQGNPAAYFRASLGGVQPDSVIMESVVLPHGSASNPDVKYETTSNNTGLVLINCEIEFMDLGSASRYATCIGKTATQSSNILNGSLLQIRGQGIRSLSSSGIDELKFIGDGRLGMSDNMRIRHGRFDLDATGDVDNLDVGNASRLVIASATGAFTLSGVEAGEDGDVLVIENTSGVTVTLGHNDSGSLAENQFTLRPKANYALENNWSIILRYSSGAGKWIRGS